MQNVFAVCHTVWARVVVPNIEGRRRPLGQLIVHDPLESCPSHTCYLAELSFYVERYKRTYVVIRRKNLSTQGHRNIDTDFLPFPR